MLSPLGGSDTMPYGLYRLLGSDFIIISASLPSQPFAPDELDNAVAAIDDQVALLVARGANLILASGTPLALNLGPQGLQDLLSRLRAKSGLPVLSSALNAVAAVQAVNARRIVVANRWNEGLNRKLTDFFAHWDIEVIGGAAEAHEAADFPNADLRKGAELAYVLGRKTLERTPSADALFIGGDAWMVEPAAERLERDFRKPVITSLNDAVRTLLQELGCWRPFPEGYGRC